MALIVFVGWSGWRSKLVAKKLASWFPEFIPGVEGWMSDDIEGGRLFWFESELNTMLRRANFAVMCVHPGNWADPWLAYEPGVVLGQTEEKHIWPYVIDPRAKRRNLPEPLKFFWAAMADENDTLKLVRAINKAAGSPLSDEHALDELAMAFKRKWPDLQEVLEAVAPPPPEQPSPEAADYIDDFAKVSGCIHSHQDRLYGRFFDVIDRALASFRAGAYDTHKTVSWALNEIQESQDRFISDDSLLVGNVAEFFAGNYTEEDLLRLITEIESALTPFLKADKQPTYEELYALRRGWVAAMKQALLEEFSKFHSKLADALKKHSQRRGRGEGK